MNHLRTIVRVLTLAFVLADAGNGFAATLIWTNGNDYWQSKTAWAPAGSFPGTGDDALFTNAATYSVTLSNDVTNIQSNFFSNAANTLATVTLNLGAYQLNPVYGGTKPGAFNVGDQAGSTTVVYLASSTIAGKGLVVPGRIVIGRNGDGTLFVTNGNVSVATTLLANSFGGRGTLVLSGPNVVWSNSATVAIGNNSNSFGSTLVISNSAFMNVSSTFRLGSGASSGGSSSNTLVLDSGARLFTHTGPVVIGNNGTIIALSPSYNNSATVQNGAVWDNGNASFVIGYSDGGGAATGNVLTVGAGGTVSNISQLTVTPGNTLNLAGGLFKATTTSSGIVQGYGTVLGSTTISSGFFRPFNSLGQLSFSNSVTIASGATITVQLGTNVSPTLVRANLTLDGTLNVTDGGGFTNGIYTIFTYNGTLTDNGVMIGTTPNSSFIYAIDTSTAGAVKLNVTDPGAPPVADFTGTPTDGAVPLVVTFTDNSTGTITNRFWNFGDGATTNTTATNLMHTYSSDGIFDVSLTVFSLSGTDTLSRSSYITATNVPLPTITSDVTITNGLLQVGNMIVIVAGDTNVFTVGATDPEGGTLSFLWNFGDGVTNAWSSSNTVEHAYSAAACGPLQASLSISNALGTITTNFTVAVACQLNLGKIGTKLSFAKTNADACAVAGSFALPTNSTFAGKHVILDVAGAQLSFTIPAKGTAVNGRSKFSTPKLNKKTGLWALKAGFKNGFWQSEWANHSMINSNIPKPGALVSDLPVILVLDTEAFMGTTNLHYTATQNKAGAAK